MKSTPIIISVLFGAGIMFLLMRSCEDLPTVAPEKIAQEIVKEKIHAEEKRVRQAAVDSLNAMHKEDVKRWSKKDSLLTAENKRLRATIRNSRQVRIDIRTDTAVFYDQLLRRDSLIEVQEKQIELAKNRLDSTTLVKDGIIDTLTNALSAETIRADYWRSETIACRSASNEGVSLGGSFGASALFGADGSFHAGPGGTFGVTWTIPAKKISLNPFKRRR